MPPPSTTRTAAGLEIDPRSEEHTSELQSHLKLVCRLLLDKKSSIAVFTAASESFTRYNINATIAESLANFRPVVAMAQREGVPVRRSIFTGFGCPYEGRVH